MSTRSSTHNFIIRTYLQALFLFLGRPSSRHATTMSRSHSATLPIIPLPQGMVLLPGIVNRVPVSSARPDIAALLSTVYNRAGSRGSKGRVESVPIACIPQSRPLASPVGPNGQLLIENGHQDDSQSPPSNASDAARVSKTDLFSSGVAANITGVEGRGTGEFSLLVKGAARVRVEKVYQTKPYFEGKVTYHQDEGKLTNSPAWERT